MFDNIYFRVEHRQYVLPSPASQVKARTAINYLRSECTELLHTLPFYSSISALKKPCYVLRETETVHM